MNDVSLQEQLAPRSICYGCGPANPSGLHVRSFVSGDDLTADWTARPGHEAFPGVVNGGIIATLLDCHSNWAAAWHLLASTGAERLPSTVTSELAVRYLRPTPSTGPLRLAARVVDVTDRRATVEASLEAAGEICATSRATFVAVGPGHPAFHRW